MPRFDFDDFDPDTSTPPEPTVYCHELLRYVPPDIVECSQFTAVAAPTLHEMQRIALPIDLRRGINDASYR